MSEANHQVAADTPDLASALSLAGRVAVVTGAASGIGQGIATVLAAAGADVVLVDVQQAECEALAATIAATGREALPLVVDVTRADQVGDLVAQAVERFGRIDVLVNNVGGMPGGWVPMLDMREDAWDAVVDLTLKSAFLCCRDVGRVMRDQQRGSIVNIASGAGQHPTPYNIAYGAAKAGMLSLTESLAVYLAPHDIRVNAVLPAGISTQGTLPGSDSKSWQQGYGTLLPRVGRAEDTGYAVAYLASDAAAFVTGAVVDVNGGPYLGNIMLQRAQDAFGPQP